MKSRVLSSKPNETYEDYKVKAISRFNLFKIRKHMKKAEMLVFGGGTLIQDTTSSKSLFYYLTILKIAISEKLKIMIYANGIGPLKNKKHADL